MFGLGLDVVDNLILGFFFFFPFSVFPFLSFLSFYSTSLLLSFFFFFFSAFPFLSIRRLPHGLTHISTSPPPFHCHPAQPILLVGTTDSPSPSSTHHPAHPRAPPQNCFFKIWFSINQICLFVLLLSNDLCCCLSAVKPNYVFSVVFLIFEF
jgi:hypothetical protein